MSVTLLWVRNPPFPTERGKFYEYFNDSSKYRTGTDLLIFKGQTILVILSLS